MTKASQNIIHNNNFHRDDDQISKNQPSNGKYVVTNGPSSRTTEDKIG